MVFQHTEGGTIMTHRHGGHLENETSEQTTQIIEQIELSGGTEECIKVRLEELLLDLDKL